MTQPADELEAVTQVDDELDEDVGFVEGEVIPVFGSDTIRDSDFEVAWIQIQLADRDDEWIDEEVFLDSPSPEAEEIKESLTEVIELDDDVVAAAQRRCLEILAAFLELDPNAVLSLIWVETWSDDSLDLHERAATALGTSADDWIFENHSPDGEEAVEEDGETAPLSATPDSWYTYDGAVTPEMLARYVELVVVEGFPTEEWHFTDSRLFSLERGMYVNAIDANGVVVCALDEADLAPFEERFGDRIVNSSAMAVDNE